MPVSRSQSCEMVDGEKVTLNHYDSLVGELRCPGCARPLSPPIKLCTVGHSSCNACRRRLKECPVCKEEFTETRSIALESLSSKVQFPCENQSSGCTIRLPQELLEWHEKQCPFQIGECFMGKVYGGCSWRGCDHEWLPHCKEEHNDKICDKPESSYSWKYEMTLTRPVISYHIFSVYDQTFNFYHVIDTPAGQVQWTLLCATKKATEAAKYYYEIELYSPENPYVRTVHRQACHTENADNILEPGACVAVRCSDIKQLLDEYNFLHYKVRIYEMDEPIPPPKPKRLPPFRASQVREALLRKNEEVSSTKKDQFGNEDNDSKTSDKEDENLIQVMESESIKDIRKNKKQKQDFFNADKIKEQIKETFGSIKNITKKDPDSPTKNGFPRFSSFRRKSKTSKSKSSNDESFEQIESDIEFKDFNNPLNSSTPNPEKKMTALEFVKQNIHN